MEQLSFLKKRPEWIRAKASLGEGHDTVSKILGRFDLTSVCMDAACPNRGE